MGNSISGRYGRVELFTNPINLLRELFTSSSKILKVM